MCAKCVCDRTKWAFLIEEQEIVKVLKAHTKHRIRKLNKSMMLLKN